MVQKIEKFKHHILIIVGAILLTVAKFSDGYTSNVLIGIGSNLVGVTVTFAVFEFFDNDKARAKIAEKEEELKKSKE